MNASQIIARVGGIGEAAKLAGVPANTVSKWKQRGSIPARYWSLFAGKGKPEPVTLAVLAAHVSSSQVAR